MWGDCVQCQHTLCVRDLVGAYRCLGIDFHFLFEEVFEVDAVEIVVVFGVA